jgi:aminopeptidase N
VASTGSIGSEALNQENQRVHRILGRGLREFAWLASDDYLVDETETLGTTVRSFYLPNDETAGRAAMNIATAALRVYSDAFGAYPFPEMLIVEAPLIHFGMEFPGMSLVGIDLYRKDRAQLEDRIAHEVAHQWWYSMVGNDPVNTPWLDEGLAEFSTAIYYQDIFGEARANTLVNQRWLVPYQAAVDSGYDAVVNQPSAAFDREYETIVYAKAALFFDALRKMLGDAETRTILREYVKRYRWRIATPEGFLQVAEASSGQDLGGLFNRWILSAQ